MGCSDQTKYLNRLLAEKSRSPEFLALKGTIEHLIENGLMSLAEGTCYHYYRELDLRRKIDTMKHTIKQKGKRK